MRAAWTCSRPASRSIGTMCTTKAEQATAVAAKPIAKVQNTRVDKASRRPMPGTSAPVSRCA